MCLCVCVCVYVYTASRPGSMAVQTIGRVPAGAWRRGKLFFFSIWTFLSFTYCVLIIVLLASFLYFYFMVIFYKLVTCIIIWLLFQMRKQCQDSGIPKVKKVGSSKVQKSSVHNSVGWLARFFLSLNSKSGHCIVFNWIDSGVWLKQRRPASSRCSDT